jgi:hypothetical protein
VRVEGDTVVVQDAPEQTDTPVWPFEVPGAAAADEQANKQLVADAKKAKTKKADKPAKQPKADKPAKQPKDKPAKRSLDADRVAQASGLLAQAKADGVNMTAAIRDASQAINGITPSEMVAAGVPLGYNATTIRIQFRKAVNQPAIAEFSDDDQATHKKVVKWLNGELGAVSAEVVMPSGTRMTVYKDGRIHVK